MERKKIKLESLNIESFVTNTESENKTVNGAQATGGDNCAGLSYIASYLAVCTPTFIDTTLGILQITYITVKTNGENTQSGYAVACSRLNCATYANLGFPCDAI